MDRHRSYNQYENDSVYEPSFNSNNQKGRI